MFAIEESCLHTHTPTTQFCIVLAVRAHKILNDYVKGEENGDIKKLFCACSLWML